MIKKLKIAFIAIFALSWGIGKAQLPAEMHSLQVFTDRNYCLSGDSVWFSVVVPNENSEQGNVIRVQLDNRHNSLINNIIVNNRDGKYEGFIHVPDSLSTGICFISAFMNARNESMETELQSKALFVYNRFEEDIFEVLVPQNQTRIYPLSNYGKLTINPKKQSFKSREKVSFSLHIDTGNIQSARVKAVLADPLSEEMAGDYTFKAKYPENIPSFSENNGFLISGVVSDESGTPQANTLVVLSIPGENPYFDYYYSGKKGEFHFYLKNASGIANVVIQAISENNSMFKIKLMDNYLSRKNKLELQSKILSTQQNAFIESLLNGKYIHKIFHPSNPVVTENFDMPARFSVPFYGKPNHHVIPDEFIDLPDFREISRELLSGVQYRLNDGEVSFRLLNLRQGQFFANEPLKLLNGIPIINNNLLARLKSTDIEYIDIVQRERMFGDLIFKGVLSVKLNNNSIAWLAQQPNLFQFKVNCFQQQKIPSYKNHAPVASNTPDVRQVFLWEEITNPDHQFEFYLSDFKGKVNIIVEGILKNNKPFQTSKSIEVY